MRENCERNTSKKKPIHLIIDHREHASRLVSELDSCLDCFLWKFGHFSCGDYLVEHKFLIERKTYSDFLNSIKDGHLFRQAYALSCSDYRSAVIVEGGTAERRTSTISRQAVLGALVHLKLIPGIPVFRTRNAKETLQLFCFLGRQIKRPDFQIRTITPLLHLPANSLNNAQRQKIKLLQMIPGLGSKKAMALLRKFGSIKKIACASTDELITVAGIGKRLAENILGVFCEEY
ncbi:MAG: ERCC4 domain-containing protein [candidate division KSB1 bacterium]|nr:ERCC4 domain-containing protein [candidate division KSB1 bacterium]